MAPRDITTAEADRLNRNAPAKQKLVTAMGKELFKTIYDFLGQKQFREMSESEVG